MSTIEVLIVSGILSVVAYVLGAMRGFRLGLNIGIGVGLQKAVQLIRMDHKELLKYAEKMGIHVS